MTQQQIYQIDVKVYLLKTVTYHDMQQQITQFIDQVMAKKEELLTLHNTNCFKYYCFSGFKTIQREGIYQEGTLNSFSVRCLDKELAEYLAYELANHTSLTMKGLTCQSKIVKTGLIQKLYLITPAVLKFEDGYWRKNHSLEEFQERIISNTLRKYKEYTQEELEQPVKLFTNFRLLNKIPIKTRYKNIHLLGDKFELIIAEDEVSQKLAQFLLGAAIGELNARGYGFLNYKSM